MYWSNYHSHSTFCDGRSSMEEFVKFAISKGLKKYGFSSHAPLPFHTKWNMNMDDFEDYQTEFKRLQVKYKDKIELYMGLEVDYIHNCWDVENNFFSGKKFDYIIGSIHFMDKIGKNEYWSIDGNFREFDQGLKKICNNDIRQAANRFFELTTLMIEKGGFQIVGHLDKITYHGMKYRDFDLSDKWFVDLMRHVLELIKQKGLMLEINTKSLAEHGITYPHQQFYTLIHEMEIPIVVNSDCHYPTNVIDGFVPTFGALKKAGFRTMQQLVGNNWQAVEFDEKGLFF